MVLVALTCALVGKTGVFGVKIDDSAQVRELKKAIKEEKPNKLKNVDADELALSLAKKGAGWLSIEDLAAIQKGEDVPSFERVSLVDTEDEAYSASIRDVLKTSGMPPPQTRQIHVLVVVPKDENDRSAMALDVPSLPPTTIHRHPERLKRWAAINEMIRQKNQEGNEKTSTRDTNKKRKNRDIDSSMPYLSLSWTDLEPILTMEDFNLEASAVPQNVVEELRDRLMQVRKLYGDVYSGKEAKRQVFIMPIFEAVCLMLGDATILVEEDVKGKNVHVHGRFEFVLKHGKKRVSIVIAKRDDIPQGIAQNMAGLEALSDVEGLERTLGIVTNYLEWVFISDDDEKIRRMNTTLKVYGAVPSTKELREIVGMICGLLANST
uniref:Crinkling and necrosis inducing protein 3 n=1 Tax=Phytophthora capsici TaxID=4784 RepID=A0A1L1UNJ1_PHYCP|nr:crinkling and necrosis inducing protein 3 [Phytophthora capsici]